MPFSVARLATALLVLLLTVAIAWAQGSGPGVGAGENDWSENSKTPFRIKLSGVINTQPEEQTLQPGEESLGVVILRVGVYDETYQFEVVTAEAIDNPRVSARMILQQVRKYGVDFDLTGPKDLLSKVGQAEPGTPLTLIGLFRQYNRTLILQNVETIGTREQ
ncbi:MAG TPA: hypothetical protein VGX03_26425 [Candidatus Binatia bacterium]|jgi:hypothetical protein|nr:hypothetical protein [Candidatus Binatia bacterium]